MSSDQFPKEAKTHEQQFGARAWSLEYRTA